MFHFFRLRNLCNTCGSNAPPRRARREAVLPYSIAVKWVVRLRNAVTMLITTLHVPCHRPGRRVHLARCHVPQMTTNVSAMENWTASTIARDPVRYPLTKRCCYPEFSGTKRNSTGMHAPDGRRSSNRRAEHAHLTPSESRTPARRPAIPRIGGQKIVIALRSAGYVEPAARAQLGEVWNLKKFRPFSDFLCQDRPPSGGIR
jgi:hypothetical protein